MQAQHIFSSIKKLAIGSTCPPPPFSFTKQTSQFFLSLPSFTLTPGVHHNKLHKHILQPTPHHACIADKLGNLLVGTQSCI